MRFVPGQRAVWKITTDQDGNEMLLIRDGVPLTVFLYNMIRDLAARRGVVCDLSNALQLWNLGPVPRPRRETDPNSRRIQQLRAEDSLPHPNSEPVAECGPLSDIE